MDGRRGAIVIRTVRLHEGLRQRDVADRAGVSQRLVSELELGRIDRLSLHAIERICEALGVGVRLDFRWRGGDLDRLVDRDHASIVDHVVGRLRTLGWAVRLEYGFNHFGERGSVDVLAWHAPTRTLLIIEVKSALTDLQATLASLDRKVRVVPSLVAHEGWDSVAVGRVLVVLGTTANRNVVDGHANVFDAGFPARSRDVLRWLHRPSRALAGLWFVAPRTIGGATRRRRTGPAAVDPACHGGPRRVLSPDHAAAREEAVR